MVALCGVVCDGFRRPLIRSENERYKREFWKPVLLEVRFNNK